MVPASDQSSSRAPERKSVLFCPACAHESPVDGDWRRQTGTEHVVYRCPACDADVTARPAGGLSAPSSGEDGDSLLTRSIALAVTPIRLAVSLTAWPYAGRTCRSRSH